jgi:hypothetical protein
VGGVESGGGSQAVGRAAEMAAGEGLK